MCFCEAHVGAVAMCMCVSMEEFHKTKKPVKCINHQRTGHTKLQRTLYFEFLGLERSRLNPGDNCAAGKPFHTKQGLDILVYIFKQESSALKPVYIEGFWG